MTVEIVARQSDSMNSCTTIGMNTVSLMSGFPTARCRSPRRPLPVVRTHGCRIVLADGRELIDGIASWWSVCHGYNHPHILECVARQLATMPHVMFGGLVHEPALRLASRLTAMVPAGSAVSSSRIPDRSPSRWRSRSRCNTGEMWGRPGKTDFSASPTAITATRSARWRSPTRKSRCTRRSAVPWYRNTWWIFPATKPHSPSSTRCSRAFRTSWRR